MNSVAIAVAEQAERAGGPRAGLFAWKKLAETATASETRGKALISAFRCALALRDPSAVSDLVPPWAKLEGDWDIQTGALCKDLTRAGLLQEANALAATEAQRRPTARSIYLHARCLELVGDARAALRYEEAITRAAREDATNPARAAMDGARERAARIRRAAVLFRMPATRADAVKEVQRIEPRDATPDERLVLARILLGAPSRFARSTALGLLHDLVSADSPLVPEARARAQKARVIAARHADELGPKLTPMELDRLVAIFSHDTPRAHAAMKAIAWMAVDFERGLAETQKSFPELAVLHKRARDVLEDRFAPGGEGVWDRLLDVATAVKRGMPGLVARRLDEVGMMAELPAQTWSVLQAALAMNEEELKEPAARLAARLQNRMPPRGWLSVATSLSMAGLDELATNARRRAAAAGEPGAAEALGIVLTRSAWQLAADGERHRALARLREAKALSESSGGEATPQATPSPSKGPGATPSR